MTQYLRTTQTSTLHIPYSPCHAEDRWPRNCTLRYNTNTTNKLTPPSPSLPSFSPSLSLKLPPNMPGTNKQGEVNTSTTNTTTTTITTTTTPPPSLPNARLLRQNVQSILLTSTGGDSERVLSTPSVPQLK
ncbi:hypothetical protein E2C01_079718 [Portunus trituberculatus]|uniref:Uncharacterized protein n=1 Tax=Portunus trituberculatus TaxID=210409 RepID=A0A5B7IRB8_PORTR|nr:hypothetical protein [Portunus trituberculatus]